MIAAILRAQWLSFRNLSGSSRRGAIFTAITSTVWYGLWIFVALAVFEFASNPRTAGFVRKNLSQGLFLMVLYWQLAPVLVASLGFSLDLKKLIIYPIPESRLFWIEVILRITTAVEMLIVLCGLAAGLVANPLGGSGPAIPRVLLPAIVFALTNLLFAAGVRNLIERLLSRKVVRELFVFGLVMVATLPQLLFTTGLPGDRLKHLISQTPWPIWPWTAAGRLILHGFDPGSWAVLLGWTAVGYAFGGWQFRRSLRFDAVAAQATDTSRPSRAYLSEFFYRLPGMLLPDPVAAMVEKETRTLARTPRFRMVFLMGFTFGLVVWLPLAFGPNRSAPIVGNMVTIVGVYALTLLGQVSYWNAFGFDRSAVQMYYAAPVPIGRALVAKNIATASYVFLEFVLVVILCFATGLSVPFGRVVESFAVVATISIYLFAAGNLSSVYLPRGMNPERVSHGGSGGRSQALILLVYPIAILPVALAYLARYAFEKDFLFFVVLAVVAAIGGAVYWIAMESAVEAADKRREMLLTELSRSDGPVSSD
ncbi:MAG: hypothetical protein ACKV22_32335 [Bryobacteraceae bacterium]